MNQYFLIRVWRGVDPSISAPFKTAEERDRHALYIIAKEYNEQDLYLRLNIDDGGTTVDSFSGAEVDAARSA